MDSICCIYGVHICVSSCILQQSPESKSRVSAKDIIEEDPKLLAQDPAKLRRELPNDRAKPKTKEKRKQESKIPNIGANNPTPNQ